MLNINTNLSSLIAQKSFQKSGLSLNQTIERMTTGYKLNHASDNAANFSISTAMTTQISSYLVAEENALMGMDLIDSAAGSTVLISNHLQRIRELAVQAENGTYGDASKKAINAEVNARLEEIERIYSSSEYNGIKFGGKDEESKFIHNINRRDATQFKSLSNVQIDESLMTGTYSITTAEELAKLATMTNSGLIGAGVEFVLGADIDLKDYDNWFSIGNTTNSFVAKFDGNGYVISNLSIKTSGTKIGLFGRTNGAEIKNVALESINIVLNGSTAEHKHIGGLVGFLGNGSTIENVYVLGENNNLSGIFVATYRSGGSGSIVIKDSYYSDFYDDYSIPLSGTTNVSVTNVNSYAGEAPFIYTNQSNNYTLYPNVKLQIGIDSSDSSSLEVNTGYLLKKIKELRNIGLKSGNYLARCDLLLKELAAKNVEFGAVQNRLESVLDEISIKYNNLISSRSTLRDSDISKESSEYIKYQILQQASATLLATANQAPAIALQLI